MADLPQTTLFMLMSLDGKITTGSTDDRDFDQDLPNISGAKEGLQQYYDLEKTTDWFSFNTGRNMAKVGWNDEKAEIEQLPVIFVIVDSKPHLTELGVINLLRRTEKLYIVTTDPSHPAAKLKNDQLEIMHYDDEIDFVDLFHKLKTRGAGTMTIQSGGEMNAHLLRAGLINCVSIVVAPLFVGGRSTTTLIEGDNLKTVEDLKKLKTLQLMEAKPLNDSYLHVRYQVIN